MFIRIGELWYVLREFGFIRFFKCLTGDHVPFGSEDYESFCNYCYATKVQR